ncbi:nitrate- and nitrite sensing domain-containing protein [Streptomyces sp. NPDC058992]|uniref:sensor histidine kinase n=1 Tax=Streptomyces sp. NPDC058992 TaxID=3346688 RepID=UPI003695CB19
MLLLALVPCLVLAGFWGVTTSQVLGEGLDLRNGSKAGRLLQSPAIKMFYGLQRERALTAVWLADPQASHAALDSQRPLTDAALATMTRMEEALKEAPPRARTSFQPLADALHRFPLPALRTAVDTRSVEPEQVIDSFSRLIALETKVVGEVSAQVDDGALVSAATPLGFLVNGAEQIGLQDTVLAPALASGTLTADARARFIMAAGTRRFLLAGLSAQIPAERRSALAEITSSADWRTMESIENEVLRQTSSSGSSARRVGASVPLPTSGDRWGAALHQVSIDLERFTQDLAQDLLRLQRARGSDLMRDALAVSAIGLAAVAVVTLLSSSVARSLLHRMAGLRVSTLELAEGRLPTLVDRLNRDEPVDLSEEAPELDYGNDELGQVVKAFNAAQRTAVRGAVALSDTRHGLEKAILGIARRTQNLVNRHIALLDTLEAEHRDPEVLTKLYQLDSQACQMRRYQENLAIMAGAQPGRRFTEPVRVVDVLRSAVSDVADYHRVSVHADDALRLEGHAVADVIHLLTELVDNATSFSPPLFLVSISVERVSKGIVIEIEDRGFGMSDDDYAEATEKLAEPQPFNVFSLADDARLGLFVVARLAAKHRIRITLRASPFGGTTALVLVPARLVVDAPEPEDARGSARKAPVTEPPDPRIDHPEAAADVSESARLSSCPPYARPDTAPLTQPNHRTDSLPPQLPRRVPQASPHMRLGSGGAHVSRPEGRPESPPAPETLATTMSAFQRGTEHARDFGGPDPRPATDPTKGP